MPDREDGGEGGVDGGNAGEDGNDAERRGVDGTGEATPETTGEATPETTADATTAGTAEYVFRLRIRVEPRTGGVRLVPATFETTLVREADPPGETGWLFFRDNLWRGELNDEAHFRDLAAEALGVPVVSASFRELRTDPAYRDALEAEVAANLELFRADDVVEALQNYLGSSIHVVDD